MAIDIQSLFSEGKCFTCFGASAEDCLELALLVIIVRGAAPAAPLAPSNPNFSDASTDANVIFTWTNNATGATGNQIWRSDNGGAFFLLATVGPAVSQYSDPTFPAVPGTYSEYKVRAINPTASAFTAARGVAFEIGALALVVYDYPRLVIHFHSIVLTVGNETTVNIPLLRRNGLGGGVLGIDINSAVMAAMDFTALQVCAGSIRITATALTNISFPALTTANGFDCSNNASLLTVSAALLTAANTGLNSSSCSSLGSADFSGLVTCGGDLSFGSCFSLTDLKLPSLTTVGGQLILNTCGALPTLLLPLLQNLGSDTLAAGCSSLVTVSLPVIIFPDGTQVNFNGDALDVGNAGAGTGVNGILHRSNLSGVTTCTIDLSGGTNASPTGGIANPDYVALVGAGNTVLIN